MTAESVVEMSCISQKVVLPLPIVPLSGRVSEKLPLLGEEKKNNWVQPKNNGVVMDYFKFNIKALDPSFRFLALGLMSHAQHCVKSMARKEFSGFSLLKHSPS